MSSSLQFLHGLFLCVYVPGIIFHRIIRELTFFFKHFGFFFLYILVHISIISFYCLSSMNCNLYNFCYVFNLSRITNYRYTLLINTKYSISASIIFFEIQTDQKNIWTLECLSHFIFTCIFLNMALEFTDIIVSVN